jgi:hypothetical protein
MWEGTTQALPNRETKNRNKPVLALFRTNQLLASILLAFYVVLVRISIWFVPDGAEPLAYGPLSGWVYGMVGTHGLTPDILAMVLLLLQATYINYLVIEHRLADETSLFPGLFYILISSALPEFLYLSPSLLANTFLIIALGEIFSIYKKADCADHIFNIGFWIGTAALFYPSYLIFVILGFVGLNSFRAFKFRERLMVIIGLLTPLLLLSVYAFWHDRLLTMLREGIIQNFGFLDFTPHAETNTIYFSLAIFAIIILIILFSYGSYLFKQVIEVQRKINLIYWALLLSALALLVQADIQLCLLMITTVPIGIMLSFNFIKLPPRIAEIIHLLMVVGVLALQFKDWLLLR